MPEIWLAPLHGLTHYHFRNCLFRHYSGFNAAISPFVPVQEHAKLNVRKWKDLAPENNTAVELIPQLMGIVPAHFADTMNALHQEFGYTRFNWNLGCPMAPIVRTRRGCGLMPYPDEVEAVVGLDMAVPECYDYTKDGTLAVPYYTLLHGLLDLGIGRYLPDSTFLPSGDFLSEEECRTWVALANRNYANIDVARECSMAKDNAATVASNGSPDVPVLMFLSSGKGTSMSDKWRDIGHRYADSLPDAEVVELDCAHYIFHFESERMAAEIDDFIDKLNET